MLFIIAAWKKGAHDLPALQAVPPDRPDFYRLVHIGRCVAVVGGQFGLKFFDKFLVLIVALALIFPEMAVFVFRRVFRSRFQEQVCQEILVKS